mmetsp:Transcript_44562/g.87286  ORF Transcript_44562/g.87286 Transcript_44562/m.87286 type:complete len:337 (+) Transcript_44562:54-1064(+)
MSLQSVRASTARVMRMSSHVQLDTAALKKEIQEKVHLYTKENAPVDWAQGYHFCDRDSPELTAQYIMVLDTLNFCFWPCEGYEYAQLAGSLKKTLVEDPTAFDADNLIAITDTIVSQWLQPPPEFPIVPLSPGTSETESKSGPVDIPLLPQRTRVLQELGLALKNSFGGKASNLILSAQKSASRLVDVVTSSLPAFRDHAVYKGDQVFFYKRAQIFTADVFLAFQGKGLGEFSDVKCLTCFADYRLPQLMYHLGIIKYDDALTQCVESKDCIVTGSEEELEIRAATVQAVEMMCDEIAKVSGSAILPLNLDNILWERGESQLGTLPPHHRCLTIYY